jgi:hypothetical protein
MLSLFWNTSLIYFAMLKNFKRKNLSLIRNTVEKSRSNKPGLCLSYIFERYTCIFFIYSTQEYFYDSFSTENKR